MDEKYLPECKLYTKFVNPFAAKKSISEVTREQWIKRAQTENVAIGCSLDEIHEVVDGLLNDAKTLCGA